MKKYTDFSKEHSTGHYNKYRDPGFVACIYTRETDDINEKIEGETRNE